MLRSWVRNRIRAPFGLAPPPPEAPAEYRARRQRRLDAESKAWQEQEAEQQRERVLEQLEADERFRMKLESRGAVFPGE